VLLLARIAENAHGAAWPELRRQLDRIASGAFTGPAGTFRQRAEITPGQATILGINLPRGSTSSPRCTQMTSETPRLDTPGVGGVPSREFPPRLTSTCHRARRGRRGFEPKIAGYLCPDLRIMFTQLGRWQSILHRGVREPDRIGHRWNAAHFHHGL
jgi:hypothetical protein